MYDIGFGVRIAGLCYIVLIVIFGLVRLRRGVLLWSATLYFVCLAAALGTPLASVSLAPSAVLTVFLARSELPVATLLLVQCLLRGQAPQRRYLYFLFLPAFSIPAAYVALGLPNVNTCGQFPGSCYPLLGLVVLYNAIVGLIVLLIFVVNISSFWRRKSLSEEKFQLYFVVLAIFFVHVVILGFNIWSVSQAQGLASGSSEIASAEAICELFSIYLVGTALFRLPVPVRSSAKPNIEPAGDPVDAPQQAYLGRKPLTAEEEQVAKRIVSLMERDKLYQEPTFGRGALARELGVSEHQVSRIINVAFGEAVTSFVNRYRIQEAVDHLTSTSRPISEIALDVGFNSIGSFNRVFKIVKGCTPTDFRAREQ